MRLNEYASTRRTRGSYKIPTSVQKSIPIDEIYADGTWRSGEVYSQMWSVSDINYAMQSDDKKQDILAKMGRIYSNIPTDCWAQLSGNCHCNISPVSSMSSAMAYCASKA